MIRSAAAMMALMVCGVTTAAPINVPGDYATIQAAVDAASNGDMVIVAPGTYTGTTHHGYVVRTLGKAITIKASGTPGETILDGEDMLRVVICNYSEGADTIIEGFTITGGYGSYTGGGIYCHNSSPTITDCTISDNTASSSGGGIDCAVDSSPTITGCTITGNTASGLGGGINCYDNCNPTITNCTISGNTATSHFGGGIYCHSSNPTITNCTISDNTATDSRGGGIYCYLSSNPTISGCTISDNTASDEGGGIYCSSNSSPTITNCTISGNTAGGLGGGLFANPDSLISIQDTSICSNVPAESQVFGDYTDNGGNTIAEVCPWYQGACCTGNDLACVVATEEDCEYFGLTWLGEGTTCDDSPCPTACLGDINGDGQVSTNDLLTVIANWGPCP